jgi:hypothetical protein
MALNLVNQVGEWNPQLFREIKGRLKPRNILIAVTVSLLGQLLLLMSFANQLPTAAQDKTTIDHRYCTGPKQSDYDLPVCINDNFGGFDINWQLWWQDVFIWLSVIGILTLLLVGTYMLISDLSKEEQRGTLNFLRLTPQSTESILIGKMLGVPILLYLVGFLALPLHLAAGLSGQMPFGMILGFYTVLGASCLFFYSVALLFGLLGTWLGGFQAWLGSGIMLIFLYSMTLVSASNTQFISQSPIDWITLFSPTILLTYLTGTNSLDAAITHQVGGMEQLKVWGLPVGASVWSALGVMLLNYGLWTYWAWQGLKRCFHNPSATLFGKQQSYWLTACFEVVILGFALNPQIADWKSYPRGLFENFQMLLVFNLLMFLCLIAALSPHRQAMQDWARYRHKNRSRKRGVMSDLIWGEKSPAVVAMALNVAIASAILLPWLLLWPDSEYKTPALWALMVNMSLIVVYAAVCQLILFMKLRKRAAWAAVTVGLLIVLPPLAFAFLSMSPDKNPGVWLFSAFPWVAVENTSAIAVFLSVIGQSLTVGLLSLQLTRRLRIAGESSTKAMLSGRLPAAVD